VRDCTKVSRLPRELVAVLGGGVEVIDWEPSGCKRRVLSALASSGAEGRRVSWQAGSGRRGAASGAGT